MPMVETEPRIVDDLRDLCWSTKGEHTHCLYCRAADEIERLQAKLGRIERLAAVALVADGQRGAMLRIMSIRAELGIAENDPRILQPHIES